MREGWELQNLGDILKLEYGKPLTKEKRDATGTYVAYGANGIKCRTNEYYWDKPSIIVGRKGSAGEINLTEEKFWPLDVTYFVVFDDQKYDLKFLFFCLKDLNLTSLAKGVKPGINRNDVYALKVLFPPLLEQKRIVAILDEAFAGIDAAVANTEKNLANARELFESYLNGVFTRKGDGWVEKTLGDMCERITKGSSPKWQGIEYVDKHGVLFVTSENVGTNQMLFSKTKYVEDAFNQKDSKSILKRGDVLTNIVGASIGRTAVFDRNDLANINQAVCLLRCEPDKLINMYLAYILNSPFFKQILHDNEIDNARANLSLGFFKSLTIPIPPIEDQVSIVAEIDSLREQTQRLESIYQQKLTTLAELKQSILQKAFAGELTILPEKTLEEAVA